MVRTGACKPERPGQGGFGRAVMPAGRDRGRPISDRPQSRRSKSWKHLDELHQMYLVPSSYNFVESNKSYEN